MPLHRVEQQITGLHTGGQPDQSRRVNDDAPFVQYGREQFDHVQRSDGVKELGEVPVVRNGCQPLVRVRVAHLDFVAEHFVVYVVNLRLGDQTGRADLGLKEALEEYGEVSFLEMEE